MNQSISKKRTGIIPRLVGIIAMLIILVGITGCAAVSQQPPKAQPAASSAPKETANPSGYPAEYQIQFEQEWKMNKDFKGYLTLEGTALSTNVVQGDDNIFYRDHGFDGSADTRIAFLDYRTSIETPSRQMLIYLPHVENHEKYGELVGFKNLEYYKAHPIISFNTLHQNAKYKIFSVALFPSGYEGLPYQSCIEPSTKEQFVTLVQKAMEHSILDIPVDVRDNDELLTVMSEDLSLMDENGKYARIVVFARKIRQGESEAVNTQKAAIRSNPYISESWYQQILQEQYVSTVNDQIRQEAAKWFSAYELSTMADADLERMMNSRKAEYRKYLTEQEMLLSADEKAYLYEKRRTEAENPELFLDMQNVIAKVGDEIVMNVTRAPLDPNATYTWSSSDSSIVSVRGEGTRAIVTARKEGMVNITVTSGNASISCGMEVKGKEQFVLNPSYMTIFVDNSYNIKASSDIQSAYSSDPDVASVSISKNLCNVYGKAPGETTVTVVGKNGMSSTCKVIVKKYQLTFDKTSLDMRIGNRRNIYVSTGAATNWYVDNSSVVKMSIVENGKAVLVEAIGTGTATVTATARNGAQATCKITVNSTGVAFSTNRMDLQKGEFREMRVTRGNVARWEVADKSVADICIYGDGNTIEVEGRGYGSTTIKAYGTDGSTATLTVNVSAPRESLTIAPYSLSIELGYMRNVTVTSGTAVNWVSSNPDVAGIYVMGDGKMAEIEARKPGTAIITVYDQYGGWVNCNVTVEAPVAKLVIGPGNVRMNVGDWEDLSVTSGRAVDWTSSNSSVVGVYTVGGDNNNVRIKANGAGTAQVIGYAADGSTAVCNVTVEEPYTEALLLNKTSMSITVGGTDDMRVTSGHASNWTSSNPSVAEVFVVGDGSFVQVEGRMAGTATITAYSYDGSTATCTVTVEAPYAPPVVENPVRLNQTTIYVEEGDWGEIYVTGGRCINWNSSNQNIVRLFDVGDPTMIKIKGESAGTTEVIAYGADGSTAVCTVIVNAYQAPVSMAAPNPVYQEDPIPEATYQEPIPETNYQEPAPEISNDFPADDFSNG